MTDWIKASNPTAPITTEAEAIGAARASAIAIFLGVLYGTVSLVFGMDAVRAGVEAQMAANPQPGMTSDMLTNIAMGMGVFFILVQLVLGWVQWAKPNTVIPIIFAILVAFGLITGLMEALDIAQPETAGQFTSPVWITWGGVALMVIQLVMHIAGIRGARALDKIRMAAAQ